MGNSTIVRRTKTRWYLATNDLFDPDGDEPYIDWSTLLSGVPGGTAHQRRYLLKSARGFMDALVQAPRDQKHATGQRQYLSHGTVLNWYWEVRALVRWMTERGVWKFSSLTSEDIHGFIQFRKVRRDGRGPVKPSTQFFRNLVLRQMWMLRSRYLASLKVNPLTLGVQSVCGRPLSGWKAIDEGAALALVNDALNWIELFGPFVIKAMNGIWDQSKKVVGVAQHRRDRSRTRFYAALEHEPEIARLRALLDMPECSTYRVYRRAIIYTNGACVVVVLFLIGLRIGEFARLDHDCLIREHDSNGMEVSRLRGIAAKQNGRDRSWVACKEVEAAINHVLGLTANIREQSGRKSLWLNQCDGTFFQSGRRVKRTDSSTLAGYMKNFAMAPFRGASPPIKRIHPHAARKTFARFVVLRNKSGLGPLARHFGHVCTTITDGSYVGSDIELEKMLSEEGRLDLARNLMDLLKAPHAAGKAADAISNARSQAPAFKGRKGLERFVEKLIDDGVQLAPCDWGYCVYSQALSACRGDSLGPNETRRSPDVCSTCANFVATDQHRPWWEARLNRDQEFLERSGLPEQTVALVTRRRDNSAKIVAGLLPRVYRSSESGA